MVAMMVMMMSAACAVDDVGVVEKEVSDVVE